MKAPLPRMKILGENLFIKEKKCIFASKEHISQGYLI